jgi:hypothetical protein
MDSVEFLQSRRNVAKSFSTGVSLHGHTRHSWECLRLLSGYRQFSHWLFPALAALRWHHWRATRQELDLARTFWTPPLGPAEAMHLERRQIHDLGLSALVSLTDHDDIESGLSLAADGKPQNAPVSLEWTIPFEPTFFHLGIHNLPQGQAREIVAELFNYTTHPADELLEDLLALLNEHKETLVILNHPLWDEGGIGRDEHLQAVQSLLANHGWWIHALELNGLRPWPENLRVTELANAWGMPLISGGDRHGLEPNANINLTNARNFDSFASEVREDRLSHVLFMPQYQEPMKLRWLETVRDIVASTLDQSGQLTSWTDRFYYEGEDGVRRPFSALWRRDEPSFIRALFAALRLTEFQRLRPALRLAFADNAPAGF